MNGENPQIPYVPQETGAPTCSIAAMRMALQRFGFDRPDHELMAEFPPLPTLHEEGFNNDGFGEHLERIFICNVKNESQIADIEHALKEGKVVIVNFVLGEEPHAENGRYRPINGKKTDGHYAVVVALDGNDLIMHDPEMGPDLRMSLHDFLHRWHAYYSHHKQWTAIISGIREEALPLLTNISP